MSAKPDIACRAYTQQEAKEVFLNHVRCMIRYWRDEEGTSTEDKLSGLAFSILSLIDGSTLSLPAMDLVLRPHESDQQYCAAQGENWWVDGMVVNGSPLHEEFYRHKLRDVSPGHDQTAE